MGEQRRSRLTAILLEAGTDRPARWGCRASWGVGGLGGAWALNETELLQHPRLIPLLPTLDNDPVRKLIDDQAFDLHRTACRRDVT
jgi:hypothetical protein